MIKTVSAFMLLATLVTTCSVVGYYKNLEINADLARLEIEAIQSLNSIHRPQGKIERELQRLKKYAEINDDIIIEKYDPVFELFNYGNSTLLTQSPPTILFSVYYENVAPPWVIRAMLAHELGHIKYHHQNNHGSSRLDNLQQLEADNFAVSLIGEREYYKGLHDIYKDLGMNPEMPHRRKKINEYLKSLRDNRLR